MADNPHTEGGGGGKRQRQVLLITTVEVGDGQPENINVREGDNTYEVARDFVLKHGLPEDIIPELARHLRENLEAHMEQQAQNALKSDNAVFSRLYQQALELRDKLDEQRAWVKEYEMEVLKANKPRMTWISMAMMRDRSAGPFSNYGEMLYVESMHKMQMKQEKVQKLKEEREAKQAADMTFKPQLSPRTKQIRAALHFDDSIPTWKRLADMYVKTKQRFEKLRLEKESKEDRLCTFKPAVSSRNEKLAQHAVQRYLATSPTPPAAPPAAAAAGDKANSSADSQEKDSRTEAISPPVSPGRSKRLSAIERLYGDAMRRMQSHQEKASAKAASKPLNSSTGSAQKMSTSGSYTAQLKRNQQHSVAGGLRASSAGSAGGSLGSNTAARAAARAAASAIAKSTNGQCARKAFGNLASCAGALQVKQSIAGSGPLGTIAELGNRSTFAGTAGGLKALHTAPAAAGTQGGVRASMAGGVRASMAGAHGSPRKSRAWH